jgi:ACS family hexuronate transporter-like MFS transporter
MFKIKGLRWYIAGMIMLVTTINYMDRTALSVAAPTLKEELHIDVVQFSYIIVCFQICYMIMQPLSGRILDWLHLRWGFALAVTWWTIAKMLHAFARSPFSLGIYRGLLGIGEAGNFPGVAKTGAEWFPPKERTIATGIANIGSGTGALIAVPLVSWLIVAYSWQAAFVYTGIFGFVWAILWLIIYRQPEKHPCITPEELAYIKSGQQELNVEDSSHEKGVWKVVLPQRNFWAIALSRFLTEPAWQFFTNWIPLYLTMQRGMNIKEIAMFAWLPFLAADLGSFIGGFLSPMYQKFGFSVLTARKAAMTTGVAFMPMALLIATGGWAIFWFCFGAFGHNCITAVLLTLPADVFPRRTVGTANGLTGGIGYFGGMLFTLLTGYLVQHIGYGPVIAAIPVMDIAAAVALWTLLRTPPKKAV